MAQGRLSDSRQPLPKWLHQNSVSAYEDSHKPVLIDMTKKGSADELQQLVHSNPIFRLVDNYDEQLAELFVSRNPQLYQAPYEVKKTSLKPYMEDHYGHIPGWQQGTWVYYPWTGHLIHVLEEELFWEARTIRNRDLITVKEQKQFRAFNAGFAGMSVGSNAALATVLEAGSANIKLVDSATISASNLNRILTNVSNIGDKKSTVVARRLYEMNPYVKVHELSNNLDEKTLDDFFSKPWPIHAVVDEIDDLKIKIRLRVEARKRGIPVLMATDLADDVMLDVERFDLDKNLPLFHGMAGNIESLLEREVSKREWLKYATQIINTKNVPLVMQKSLLKIGTKLVTQPQLGGTAMTAGATIAFALRTLASGDEFKSKRMIISFEKAFTKQKWPHARLVHRAHTRKVDRTLGEM